MNQDVGDRQTIAGDLSNLGDVAAKRGNFDRAAERFEEALDIFRNVGDRIGVASTLSVWGGSNASERTTSPLGTQWWIVPDQFRHWLLALLHPPAVNPAPLRPESG